MSKIYRLMLLSFGIYVFLAALLFVFQRTFLYFPSPEYPHGFDKTVIINDSENIEVIVLNPGRDDAFIYFGGNAEAVVKNAPQFLALFPDMTMYLVNYRGYGASSGKPTEEGLFSDARAIYDRFAQEHNNMAVVGRSLGSGVAMHLAANRLVSAAVLITPFDSILALAKKQYPMFPISLLLLDTFDSIGLAKDVSAPVLIIAGGRDRLIPLSHSQRLLDELGNESADMFIIEKAGHNDIAGFADFDNVMVDFLRGFKSEHKTK